MEALPEGDFKQSARAYYAMLERYRFMSFGTQIVLAVRALGDPEMRAKVTAELRHLIVDEYQDVNPAQEELIRAARQAASGRRTSSSSATTIRRSTSGADPTSTTS